jgi:hypothetical protein
MLKIDKFDYRYNKNGLKVIVNLDNSDSERTLFNFSLITSIEKTFVKMTQLVTISIAEDEKDMEYRRTLLKTTIDICRLGQIQSTYFAKAFMANFGASSDHEHG